MQWMTIMLGLMLLLIALLTGALLRMRMIKRRGNTLYGGPRCRLHTPRRTIHYLRKAAAIDRDRMDILALKQGALSLVEHMYRLSGGLRSIPALPGGGEGEPRLMSLARETADAGRFTSEALAEALREWEDIPPTPSEASAFPLCVALANCDRLGAVLKDMVSLPEPTEEQLLLFCDELRRAQDCFDALMRLDWLQAGEACDPVHAALLKDPTGVYGQMDKASRLELRRRVEAFSCHAHMEAEALTDRILALCDEAEEHSLEKGVCFWLWDSVGLKKLHRSLHTRKGLLYALFIGRPEELKTALLWVLGFVSGFTFLQARQPVFMLPVFALTAGCIWRSLLRKIPGSFLPRMTVSPKELKTLVVLPCVLHDPHEAIGMVRQLKTVRHSFPEKDVDFLLLGDFADSMTAVSSTDAGIIQAAAAAIDALQDERVMYLQRGRIWDGSRFAYSARGSRQGALQELYRLIVQGECADVIAFSTVEAAVLERRYAYVLPLLADVQPAPGMLDTLLCTAAHPLCNRYPTPEGWRGFSVFTPEGSTCYEGTGLLQPDAFLEATDGLLAYLPDTERLAGELAGWAAVDGAQAAQTQANVNWESLHRRTQGAWQLFRWQLPWVQTPSGFVRNPLGFMARFRLRESLRNTLIPAAQLLLLLWAILTRSWILLAIALFAPELSRIPRRRDELLRFICKLSLLPGRAVIQLWAAFSILFRRSDTSPAWESIEIWAQGIAAALLTGLALVLPGMTLPALALGVLFACFPLAHRVWEAPYAAEQGLTADHSALLEHAAQSTWNYFLAHTDAASAVLPPHAVQFQPALGAEPATSPEAIGAYLLACVCAKELGYLTADAAASRIRSTMDAYARLSMPYGLPCNRYDRQALTVLDARVDAASAGFLLASLMTTAQALRFWLPELHSEHEGLSAVLSEASAAFNLEVLFDPLAGLFHRGLDENGQGTGYVRCFSDAALLLSIAACAQRKIPPAHFDRLSRTCIMLKGDVLPLSEDGSTAAYLLSSLFLPTERNAYAPLQQAMVRRGSHGIWGQGESGYFDFDRTLRIRRDVFGFSDAALSPASRAPVYAPYAAALFLPHHPGAAAEALEHFFQLGAQGPHGFCDAVDFSQGPALVGLHDTWHQGLMLAALSCVLADSPVQRYFTSLPEVEACLPLLKQRNSPLILPRLPFWHAQHERPQPPEFRADPLALPVQTCTLGAEGFFLKADAWGCSTIADNELPLTRVEEHRLYGPQFYLRDEGRTYRLADGLLQGETVFLPGEIRYVRLCGSLKTELVCTVDTIRRRVIHLLTITNLSTRDRRVEVADFLLPDMNALPCTMETSASGQGRISLHARGTSHTLYHTADTFQPADAMEFCTDADAFLGRNGSLHAPLSLDHPVQPQMNAAANPCLSFRLRLLLGGRGQTSVWFTTSLLETDPPTLPELTGLRRMAALQHSKTDDMLPFDLPQQKLPLPAASWKEPLPARLPEMELLHRNEYGGFDPENDDYVILLAPGKTTPASWPNTHRNAIYAEKVDESGFLAPFREEVWIRQADATLLSPWSTTLPRSIRVGQAMTVWEAWSDQLDIRLCAACLPGRSCGLRVLRIRNALSSPLTLRVNVLAHLDGCLDCRADGVVSASAADGKRRFIAGDGWEARRVMQHEGLTNDPPLDLPDESDASTALLETTLQLPAQGSAAVIWMSGLIEDSDEIDAALKDVQVHGASALLREAREQQSSLLSVLTFSTPEDTLDLLLNRTLPLQAAETDDLSAIPALAFLSPGLAAEKLHRAAASAVTREEWLQIALHSGVLALFSGEKNFLERELQSSKSLFQHCKEELLSLPLDRNGLPMGDDPARRCLLYALSAKLLDAAKEDPALQEYRRKLLQAADATLWNTDHYSDPLKLDIQALACAAFDSGIHARQAFTTAWQAFYDPPHGLIQQEDASDLPLLPGLPDNGGMITASAVMGLHALFAVQQKTEAFELLRALNPIHHTDAPERMEVFRCAPYRLHGGMQAAPMEAGRAEGKGGAEAAALLYAVILHDLIGIRRSGRTLTLTPCIPPDWDDFSLTLREGTSTWHISAEKRVSTLTVDGDEVKGDAITLVDDGRVHQVRFPLR